MLRHLDLCSGIGGFSLGLALAGGFRTVGFAETDPFCCEVLRQGWPGVPNLGDLSEIEAGQIPAHDIATAGSPASPSLLLESGAASEMTAGSGRRCLRYSLPPGPVGFCLRTFLLSQKWHSTIFSLTWKVRTTPAGRLFFQLRPSARPTGESGCSSWPTPKRSDGNGARQLGRVGTRLGGHALVDLFPWPTLAARDWKGGDEKRRARGRADGKAMDDLVPRQIRGRSANYTSAPTGESGRLEVALCCWLMGFPEGLLRSARSAMPSSCRLSPKSGAP